MRLRCSQTSRLPRFYKSLYNTFWMLMAASLIVMLPVLIIFVLFQRYFIEGITLTGMKG